MNSTWHLHCDPDWQALAPADGDAILAAEIGDRFHAKQGRSIARWKLSNQLVVYLKRHYREGYVAGWLAALTRRPTWSTAWQEAEHLRWAAANGFCVPRPVAVGTAIGPWGRMRGFLAVEELTGMLPLHELIPLAYSRLPVPQFQVWKRGLIAELARIARELHGKRAFHKDLYLCHFYAAQASIASPSPWRDRVAMIDLHRLNRHPFTWPWWQLKDLAQLLYSSNVAGVTARDRLRFWKLYAGGGRRSGWGPWVRRLVLVRWNNYRGHNDLRRAA